MSKKPSKKSDATKQWMQPRKNRVPVRLQPEYHLIVSEGTKTEPLYFKGLREEVEGNCCGGRRRITIKTKGTGCNTLSLLDQARQYVENSDNPIKHVWLVYDKDDFPSDAFDNTSHKCRELNEAADVTYHALWSNQCIELWFLLHFEYMHADIKRTNYIPKLTERLGSEYTKNRDDIYVILRPFLNTAITNAKKLIQSHNDPNPSHNRPGTNVYEIFEYLSDYLDSDIEVH